MFARLRNCHLDRPTSCQTLHAASPSLDKLEKNMKLRFHQKVLVLSKSWAARAEIKRVLVRRYWKQREQFNLDFCGVRAKFSTKDFYSNYWFYGPQTSAAVYEPAITSLLASRVRRARAFADVGANLGYFTVVAG